jgi:hypothetical protein
VFTSKLLGQTFTVERGGTVAGKRRNVQAKVRRFRDILQQNGHCYGAGTQDGENYLADRAGCRCQLNFYPSAALDTAQSLLRVSWLIPVQITSVIE